MTKDEALKIWLPVIKMGVESMQECSEALDMAIKALEQEPFMNKPCVAHQICHEDKVKVLDKIRAEIIDTLYVDSLIFGELIDFRNGKISADDVIEEFNRVTRAEVLQIIDKYREPTGAESEEWHEV